MVDIENEQFILVWKSAAVWSKLRYTFHEINLSLFHFIKLEAVWEWERAAPRRIINI